MPLAALFVVQAYEHINTIFGKVVSMPLAALFVVQVSKPDLLLCDIMCFNAARGFVCGASSTAS